MIPQNEATAAIDDPEAALDQREDRICQQLLARGRLKDADFARARRLHEESGSGSLIALMTRIGLVSERDVAEASAEVFDLPLITAKDFPENPPTVQVSVRFLKQQHVCPLSETEDRIELLVADPADDYPVEAIRMATGRSVQVKVGLRAEIDDLIERYFGSGRSAMGTIVEDLGDGAESRDEDDVDEPGAACWPAIISWAGSGRAGWARTRRPSSCPRG